MAEDLSLDSPWSIREAGFAALVANLAPHDPRIIVEFGSGVSTARLALAFPNATVFSIDHLPWSYERTSALLVQYAIPNAEVLLRPLAWQWHRGLLYRSYRPGPFPPVIDAVLIDGPPGPLPKGREACLHQVARHLAPGAHVYLDDLHRDVERQTWRAWRRQYRGQFTRTEVREGEWIGVMTLTGRARLRPGWVERVRHHVTLAWALAAAGVQRPQVQTLPRLRRLRRALRRARPRAPLLSRFRRARRPGGGRRR